MNEKIKIMLSLIFLIFVIESSLLAASTADGYIDFIPDKYNVSPGDTIKIKVHLERATHGLISFTTLFGESSLNFTDPVKTTAITGNEVFIDASYTPLSKDGIIWGGISNLNKYPYQIGFASSSEMYIAGEDIAVITLKINPNYKGTQATLKLHITDMGNTNFDQYTFPPDKEITFNVKQSDTIISKVKYTVDPVYTITIPPIIEASPSNDVLVDITGTVNMEDGKQVRVGVADSNIIMDRYKMDGTTIVTGEGAMSITTALKLGTNTNLSGFVPLAVFEYGTDNLIKDKLYINKIDISNKKAGIYIGNINFDIAIIDK